MNKFNQFLGIAKKSGNILQGYNKCQEGLMKKRIHLLIFSETISQNSKDKFIKYCTDYNTRYIGDVNQCDMEILQDKEDVKIVGITNLEMSNRLLQLWNEKINCFGGEYNGKD